MHVVYIDGEAGRGDSTTDESLTPRNVSLIQYILNGYTKNNFNRVIDDIPDFIIIR